jgi:putative endonuclease
MNTKTKGNLSEQKASEYLKSKNYKITERNFYSKFGEIDIIAFKDGVYHFVEVKSGEGFEPIYNITPAKLQRVIKTAYVYMKKNRIDSSFCIDAIIIKSEQIEFIENISF